MLDELVEFGSSLGFSLVRDTGFEAVLSRADGAALALSADRSSHPAFSLEIVPTGSVQTYAVWLLMSVREPAITPSWTEQLAFLERESAMLFENEAAYRESYAEADSSI